MIWSQRGVFTIVFCVCLKEPGPLASVSKVLHPDAGTSMWLRSYRRKQGFSWGCFDEEP